VVIPELVAHGFSRDPTSGNSNSRIQRSLTQVAAAEARLVELKAQQAAVERSRAALAGGEKSGPGGAKASIVDTAATAAQAVQRHQVSTVAMNPHHLSGRCLCVVSGRAPAFPRRNLT
jgi:hypothetical protein